MSRSALGGLIFALSSVVLSSMGCGGGHPNDARYPKRPDGCAVQIFQNAPSVPTDNLGTVRSRCALGVPHPDCIRELKDQVCRLGGDVVWGVEDEPRVVDEKNEWDGRAAHTK